MDGNESQHRREQQRWAESGDDLQPLLAVAFDPAPEIEQRQHPPPAQAEQIGPRPPAAAEPEPGALRFGIAGEQHAPRSEEHTSELQSLMRISYAVFCLKKKNKNKKH